MGGESIYQFITHMFNEHPGLPYVFQDPYIAGERDIHYVLVEDELPFTIKEKMAMEIAELIIACLEEQSSMEELKSMLEEKPIFLYLTKLNSRLKLLISENLINVNELYSFGLKLATQSESEDEVKLGMIILGYFGNDLVRQILKTLGLHSSLTLYALEASKNFENSNQFVFELAKNTCGYGKLIALYLLEPVLQKQKEWVLEKGAINQVAQNMSAIMCIEKVDMEKYYTELVLNETTFSKMSYLIAYASEMSDIKKFTQSFILIEKYLNASKKYVKSFIDLVAIIMILKDMNPNWYEIKVDIKNKNGWSGSKESEFRDICNNIINKAKWKFIVSNELEEPQHKTSLIIAVLNKLKIVPEFFELIPLLQRDLFDMDILDYVLIEYPEVYLEDVYKYLFKVLPDEVLIEDPKDLSDEDITSDNKPDIWLVYLLKALRREKKNEEILFIRSLTCRFPDARIEAIQALRTFRLSWSERVFPALEHAYEIEPVKNIKKRILRLMGKSNDVEEKEQRFVDVSQVNIAPSPLDRFLLETKIAGTFYRDLSLVEDQIEVNDILYLVREADNKYDEKAILVTAEDGYVLGYVPRTDNSIPQALIDAGEKLYAVLLSNIIEKGKLDIKIMLSKNEEEEGKIIKFPYYMN